VAPGSEIISDDYSVYVNNSRLPKQSLLMQAFPNLITRHRWINHSVAFVDFNDDTLHTNSIENHWKQLKCRVPRNVKLDKLLLHMKKFLLTSTSMRQLGNN